MRMPTGRTCGKHPLRKNEKKHALARGAAVGNDFLLLQDTSRRAVERLASYGSFSCIILLSIRTRGIVTLLYEQYYTPPCRFASFGGATCMSSSSQAAGQGSFFILLDHAPTMSVCKFWRSNMHV
jgi:hypothetical protein